MGRNLGSDFPDEYAHSKDTKVLRGPNEYAKANASSAIKELIQIASNKAFTENHKDKHNSKAKYGWYRDGLSFSCLWKPIERLKMVGLWKHYD